MKKRSLVILLLAALFLLGSSLSACAAKDAIGPAKVHSPSSNSTSPLFKSDRRPVASSQGLFIVRNESGNLYGLVDHKGKDILPCEYGALSFFKTKSQTVLKAMRKGSYGVYDLSGNELIPCEYTDIRFSPYNDSCIVKNFKDKWGALDFAGNTLMPIEYDVLRYDNEKIITDALTSADWGQSKTVESHVFYFQGEDLFVRNIDTQEEIHLWRFPNGHNCDPFQVRTTHHAIDPVLKTEFVDLFVVGGRVNEGIREEERHDLRISFGDTIEVIDYNAIGIDTRSGMGYCEVGPFYNGVAMVFPKEGCLYTINTAGEKVNELTNPYTVRDKSALLGNAAVLNNNGYYSIVDSTGKTLLNENGYSDVRKVSVHGIYMVTDQNGMSGLINEYAEELVPCGGIDAIETAIARPNYDAWKLEASHETEEELYVLYNKDQWAIYSTSKCHLLTSFMDLENDDSSLHDCVLGNSGYLLINEEGDHAYWISCDADSYQVSSYLSLA